MAETLPSGANSKQFDPDSKFHVRNQGELMHPACCTTCGSGSCDEGFVDLGTYYDYEGQLYICMFCVYGITETVGLLNRFEIDFLKNKSEELATQNSEL